MKPSVSVVSNIFTPVSPAASGGLEVFNYYLTRELEKRGVDVRLYASGDSARLKSLVPIVDKSLSFSKDKEFLSVPWNYRKITVEEFAIFTKLIQQEIKEKRILHFSLVNFLPIYLAVKNGLDVLTTIHMPATNYHYQVLRELLNKEEIKKVHFIGISRTQVEDFSDVYDVIPNGVNLDEFKYSAKARDAYVSIGRIVPEKGYHDAISAAKKANVNFEFAGIAKSKNEIDYFEQELKPNLSSKIRYVGFVKEKERKRFYQAKAQIFPTKWKEAFGLTMIEAMACGTPVIAYDRGAVKEIIVDNKTGFIVKPDDVNGIKKAIEKIEMMSKEEYLQMRQNCREHVEKHFSITAMVDKYIQVYKELAQKG
jgi:glycosyltransferase involved in cell wall biosynthesis